MTTAINILLQDLGKNILSRPVTHIKEESSELCMTLHEESVLIAGILRKEEACVMAFVKEYEDQLYAQSYRMLQNSMDAEEVCQDVFLKAMKRLGDFEGKSKLSTWLYSIAYTTCLDVLKKRKRSGYTVDIEDAQLPEWTQIEGALSQLERKEQRQIIDESLEELEATDALIIDLYYLQGVPTKEITEITDMSEGNIRIRLMRARKKLAKSLANTLPSETLDQYR